MLKPGLTKTGLTKTGLTKRELLRDEITELKKQVKEKTKIWEQMDKED